MAGRSLPGRVQVAGIERVTEGGFVRAVVDDGNAGAGARPTSYLCDDLVDVGSKDPEAGNFAFFRPGLERLRAAESRQARATSAGANLPVRDRNTVGSAYVTRG